MQKCVNDSAFVSFCFVLFFPVISSMVKKGRNYYLQFPVEEPKFKEVKLPKLLPLINSWYKV